jgi:(2Fe-2S) ferredoxin
MVIYPEGIWYRYSKKEDIDEIISKHLLKGGVVERLLA